MRPKSMVLIVIALGCGLVASIGISQVMEGRNSGDVTVETDQIYVAMVDIPLGETLSGQTVRLEEWPKDKIPGGAIRNLEDIQGRRPRQPLFSGEPILLAKLIDGANIGGAAERIRKGWRVVSVKVNMESSASGLVNPGDRVDVLVFLRRGGEIGATGTKTILRDVTVFAVNDRIDRDTDIDGKTINAKTVSLLVKPNHVEKIMLASELGKLRLSLRRADDDTEETTDGATIADLEESDISAGDRNDPVDPESQPESPGGSQLTRNSGIIDILDNMKAVGPPASDMMSGGKFAHSHVMRIHTADGVETFTWDDPNELPVELASSQGFGFDLAESAGISEDVLREEKGESGEGSSSDDVD